VGGRRGHRAPRKPPKPSCCRAWIVYRLLRSAISAYCFVGRKAMEDRARRLGPRRPLATLHLSACHSRSTAPPGPFFGSVGARLAPTASTFLTIYIGPILAIGLCSPLIMRIVRPREGRRTSPRSPTLSPPATAKGPRPSRPPWR